MARAAERAFLDRPLARVLALLVFIGCGVALAFYHRADLFPGEAEVARDGGAEPWRACFAGRAADIDNMVIEGVVTAAQAEQFKERAEAMCRAEAGAQFEGDSAAPGLPGLPPE
jgi:hypothetical protein